MRLPFGEACGKSMHACEPRGARATVRMNDARIG